MEGVNEDPFDAPFECFDVSTLLSKFSQGTATQSNVEEYWKNIVPILLCPTPNSLSLDNSNKDALIRRYLLKPLEDFISKFEHQDLLKYVGSTESSSPQCGRLFKLGEPTYTCRECGMDSTCVLCVECFINSSHKNHKYKMRTSGGGGCCDCGDEEAWKHEPCCELHAVASQSNDSSALPDDFVDRLRFIFLTALNYAFGLLTIENLNLPSKWSDEQDECSDSDSYCTVLYNDEVHTFEQVISSLSRVIKCSQRDAIEYVTNIDREGRAIVKCATYRTCSDLKSDIERFTSRHGTKPLKVLVIQSKLLAHQCFAMKLLAWIQSLLKPSLRLRRLFADVVTLKKREVLWWVSDQLSVLPILDGILIRDSCLWKSARLNWHRLFITGMLIDYENKKIFATAFTRNYNVIIKDFINDDHEHSFSVASLSIQIFTVPTLAHYLIEKEDILFVIMNVFLSECTRKCNRLGKLEFERNALNSKFKRAIYSLYDIKYLLGSVPTEFTDPLRKGFFPGFASVVSLLGYMQGMDSVTRQIGQHMEYEPEWESAFNLHLKLAPIISLMLKWCSSDHYLLARSYRLILKLLYEDYSKGDQDCREITVNSFSALVVMYDVASQPVSIHLPLSRFLAGLTLHIKKFNLQYCDLSNNRMRPWELIEPVLRTRVMIAQVHAGMWRRNGYSLSNQIYFYNNVKCRGEMLDKDVVLLQLGAALMSNHQFLLSLLNKFNLISWADLDFEKSPMKGSEDDILRQTIHLVEEFLLLLITIIGERYVPGVGKVNEADCLKNEIIQQLCIRPLSHSELDKTLPDDINHETGMEDVIGEIAVFKKPSQGTSKGVYELKPEYFERYNVFFYHFTREELSKSEETQRKYNKSTIGLECCPPPKLPPFTDTFKKVSSLLTSDLFLYILKLVLERSLDYCARSFSEPQVHKVLHLIGYALNEEEEEELNESFTYKASQKEFDIPKLLEKLHNNPRVEAHKDLVEWTIRKFTSVSKRGQSTDTPLSLQSTLTEKDDKEGRSKLAAERKAKIMAQMAAMQKNFMKDNAHLFKKETVVSDLTDEILPPEEPVNKIAVGPNQSPVVPQSKTYICILCQEEQEVTGTGLALVYAAFVQKSTVLSKDRNADTAAEKSNDDDHLFLSSNLSPGPHTSTCGHVMHRSCWKRYFENVLSKESRRPYRHRQPSSFDIDKQEYLCPLCECLSNTVIPILPMLSSLPTLKCEELYKKTSITEWIKTCLVDSKPLCDKKNYVHHCTRHDHLHDDDDDIMPFTDEGLPPAMVLDSEDDDEIDDDEDDSPFLLGGNFPMFTPIPGNGPPPALMNLRYRTTAMNSPNAPTAAEKTAVRRGLSHDLREMILFYAQSVYSKIISGYHCDDNPLVPILAWQSCAFTIRTLEQYLRVNDKPLFGDMSCRQRDCLESLVRLSGVICCAWKEKIIINQEAAKIFNLIVDGNDSDPTILDWDSFSVLIELSCCLPGIFTVIPLPVAAGTNFELHIFMLLFYSMVAQIMIVMDLAIDDDNNVAVLNDDTSCLLKYLNILNKQGCNDTSKVWAHIKKETVPYLRCCALFFHFLNDVPPPEELNVCGGDTFENLCAYLGIPSSCNDLLNNNGFSSLLIKWTNQLNKKSDQTALLSKHKLFHNLTSTSGLVSLPVDYSELINTVSLFTCPSSDREDCRNPTMCLVCGEMLCSQTYCCQTELNRTLVSFLLF